MWISSLQPVGGGAWVDSYLNGKNLNLAREYPIKSLCLKSWNYVPMCLGFLPIMEIAGTIWSLFILCYGARFFNCRIRSSARYFAEGPCFEEFIVRKKQWFSKHEFLNYFKITCRFGEKKSQFLGLAPKFWIPQVYGSLYFFSCSFILFKAFFFFNCGGTHMPGYTCGCQRTTCRCLLLLLPHGI